MPTVFIFGSDRSGTMSLAKSLLQTVLSLYGLGDRAPAWRRRPAPVSIGRYPVRRA